MKWGPHNQNSNSNSDREKTIEQTQRMKESSVWKGIERYRQLRLAKSLFSTLLLFSLFFWSWWLLLHSSLKRMLQSIRTMTALFTNSVAIYGFVMHSSVFAHIGCLFVCVSTTWMRDICNRHQCCCCCCRHHHNANGVKYAILCSCGSEFRYIIWHCIWNFICRTIRQIKFNLKPGTKHIS